MNTSTAEIHTPLGQLCFFVEIGNWARVGHETVVAIKSAVLHPELPPGMSVAACHAVVLSVRSAAVVEDLQFFAHWRLPAPPRMSPESGQSLDAASWESAEHIVMVGTEDREALELRLRGRARWDPQIEPVLHTHKSIVIRVERLEPNMDATLHFVVAANPLPEPVECSCWYAADQPHEALLHATHGTP